MKIIIVISLLFVNSLWSFGIPELISQSMTIKVDLPKRMKNHSAIRYDDHVKTANSLIADMKLWKNDIYFVLPRWISGIPVTLGKVSIKSISNNPILKIHPYPNWSMQNRNNCSSFQSVRKIQIDPEERMWILDVSEQSYEDTSQCPPNLIVLNMKDTKLLSIYKIPDGNKLMDMVVDYKKDDSFAYILNNNKNNPTIIVFSLKKGNFWHMKSHEEHNNIQLLWRTDRTGSFISVMSLSMENNQTQLLLMDRQALSFHSVSVEMLKKPNDVLRFNSSKIDVCLSMKPVTYGIVSSNDRVFYGGWFDWDGGQSLISWKLENTSLFTRLSLDRADGPMKVRALAVDDKGDLWALFRYVEEAGLSFYDNDDLAKYAMFRIKTNPTVVSNGYSGFLTPTISLIVFLLFFIKFC